MNLSGVFSNMLIVLKDKNTYKYLVPGAVVTLFYSSFMYSMGWLSEGRTASEEALSWSAKIIYWLTSGAKWFTTMLFEFVVITLFSPIMALLSESVETTISGNQFAFSFTRFLSELFRTLGILISGFLFSSLVMLIWSLVAWIGDLKTITPYIVFLIKAFFIGFNYVDYSLERHSVSIKRSWIYAVNRPLKMLIPGIIFSFLFFIPVLGVMFAPFITTIIATLLWIDESKL
jgi:CysZ protein